MGQLRDVSSAPSRVSRCPGGNLLIFSFPSCLTSHFLLVPPPSILSVINHSFTKRVSGSAPGGPKQRDTILGSHFLLHPGPDAGL